MRARAGKAAVVMRARAIALGSALLGVARPAAAASGGAGSLTDLVWPAINLALLLGVLVYFARKPIRAFFGDRSARIRDDLDAASRALAAAEARHAEWQRKVADLDSELAAIRRTASERADAERRHIVADAQRSAERIRDDARVAIDQELRRARANLRDEAADLALLSARVTDGDRSRLVDEFIETIERGERAPGATRAERS
jgi:F-type H+-transporting ATPase subunit b